MAYIPCPLPVTCPGVHYHPLLATETRETSENTLELPRVFKNNALLSLTGYCWIWDWCSQLPLMKPKPALPLFLFFCPQWSCDGRSSRGLLGLCGDSEEASFRQQSIEMEGAWVSDEFLKLPYQPCTADFLVTLMQ